MPKPYVEIVKEKFASVIIGSDIRPATKDDIKKANKLHKQGKCPHNIIIDEHSWLYDYRSCFTCGEGLGTV